MPQPFNYSLNALDPVAAMQSGMAFGQQQRAGEQAMQMNDQSMALRDSGEQRAQTAFEQNNILFDQGQQDRVAAQEAARAMQGDLAALSEKIATGDYSAQDFAAVAAKYPDLIDEMSKMWDGASAERKASDVSELFKGVSAIKAGRPDLAIQMLEERAVAAENSGDQMEADIARATAAAIKADPAAGLTSLGLLLQSVDADAATTLFGTPKSSENRFKVVGDQLIDLDAEGGPAPVPGVSKTDMGPEWVDLKPEELVKYGFVFGQRNTKTGKVEGEKPPKGQTISLGSDGSLTITDGVGGANPGGLTNANTTEAQKASMAYDALVAGLDDYEAVFNRTGGAVVPGADKDALMTARRGLQLQMKELFNLGVLNGPDLDLLDSMLVDPTSATNVALDVTGVANLSKRFADNLAQVRKMMKDMVEPKLKALGKGGDPGSPEPPPAAATGEKSLDDLVREAEGL